MQSSKRSLQWVLLPDANMRSSPIQRIYAFQIQSNTLNYFAVIYFTASLLRVLNKLDRSNIIRPSLWCSAQGQEECRIVSITKEV